MLAKQVIDSGGCVAGAQYDDNNVVVHRIASSEEGLSSLRQSKYAQSRIGLVYREIGQLLDAGRMVLFCGAPCQVAALRAFLNGGHPNLIAVDFICRGVNSPKALAAWLDEIERHEDARVRRIWFKYKEGGWRSSPRRTRLDFDNDYSIVLEGRDNKYMCAYLESNLFIRPCCGQCSFKGYSRPGDLTLADFWGLDANIDGDKGASMVLVNSEVGSRFLHDIEDRITLITMNIEAAERGNVCISQSVRIDPRAHDFLVSLDKMPFSEAVARFGSVPWKNLIRKKASRVIHRIFRSR